MLLLSAEVGNGFFFAPDGAKKMGDGFDEFE